jgi:hypothetical protein
VKEENNTKDKQFEQANELLQNFKDHLDENLIDKQLL